MAVDKDFFSYIFAISRFLAAAVSSRRPTGVLFGADFRLSGSVFTLSAMRIIASIKASIVSLLSVSVGSIVGWGDDYYGKATPPEENDFIAIAAGKYYGLAIRYVCSYLLVGDVNDDYKFDIEDFAIMTDRWLTTYDMEDLVIMVENWLIDCNVEPLNEACEPK